MERLGAGIIGYGFIGKVHCFGYHAIPFHYSPPPLEVQLVGVATSRRETAEAARAQGGFATATDDWRELVADPRVQIINICSPNTLHAEQLVAAMAAGKHIYCDKPLTAAIGEVDAVRHAMAKWKGIGQMTLQYRFVTAVQRAKQLIEEGYIGSAIGFRGVYLHSGSVDPAVPLKWKLRGADGGGVLRDLGPHLFDLVDWLAGPIVEMQASTRILHAQRPDGRGGMAEVDGEDQAVIVARLAGGAIGTMEVSKIATGAEDDLRLEINGDRGALRFSLMDPDFLEAYSLSDPDAPTGGMRGWKRIATLQRYGSTAVFPAPRSTAGWLRAHTHGLHEFLRAVAAGRQGEPSLQRGIVLQQMIDCAERSAAAEGWQKVAR
ncbi:MAG: Gfo/Idh/MocA family oxidoreductase [Spirochaetia bacterium]